MYNHESMARGRRAIEFSLPGLDREWENRKTPEQRMAERHALPPQLDMQKIMGQTFR